MKKTINLAVKDFATPVLPKGDLRREGSMLNAIDLGVALHQKIQTRLGQETGYQRECSLSTSYKRGTLRLKISGRADGIFQTGDEVIIEEIKTTFAMASLLTELGNDDEHPYRLQALTYGHLYHRTYGIIPKVRLRIACLRSETEEVIDLPFDPTHHRKWVHRKLSALARYYKALGAHILRRKRLAADLTFPFAALRLGQAELIQSAQEALQNGAELMIQAPTGIGKTMGLIYPGLKHALARGTPLIYLTPKNSQFKVVKDTLSCFHAQGKAIKTLFITAKSKLCLKDEPFCDPSYCEYARGYYDKLSSHNPPREILQKKLLDSEFFLDLGRRWEVCPYALSLTSLDSADIIVGDYNYVFSPHAALKRLSTPTELQPGLKHSLLIDEAHNLYSRCMDYYSPAIDLAMLKDLAKEEVAAPALEKEFLKQLTCAIDLIKSLRPPKIKSSQIDLEVEPFMRLYLALGELLTEYAKLAGSFTPTDPVLALYLTIAGFTEILLLAGDESRFIYHFTDEREELKILCCNPSKHIGPILKDFHAKIAFSATLKPFEFYRQLSGMAESCRFLEFESGFPPQHRKVIIIPQISTAYRDRSKNYAKIADAILRIAHKQYGHYLVFCPSFSFIAALSAEMTDCTLKIYSQTPRMKAEELTAISEHWFTADEHSLTFAVQGGGLAEGFDADTPYLLGAFVVGPALPNYEFERELLREYYETTFKEGYAFAYVYPAMAKSIQAAGRVIRSETKRGLIVLMDRRFLWEDYSRTMPSYWYEKSPMELAGHAILSQVESFWAKSP